MSKLQNAIRPLIIPTHDGSGQATHPSIIDFLVEHDQPSWGGYRYWMAFTPYPNTNDEHEDPNIVASHDGITWVVPSGIVNPLDDLFGQNYNADTDIVYDPLEDCLRVYYRSFLTDGVTPRVELRMVKIMQNRSITSPIVSITVDLSSLDNDKIRSQAIWRESSTRWHMWANGGSRPYKMWYLFSTDGINWGEPQQCFNQQGLDPFEAIGYENWHPSCKPNYKENRIEFFVVDFITKHLIYAECPMNNPTLVTTPLNEVILEISDIGKWDSGGLYRSSFVIDEKDGQQFYRLWYSGFNEQSVWRIGYTEGKLVGINDNPIPIGYISYRIKNSFVDIPIYELNDIPTSPLKIYFKHRICCLNIVDLNDEKALPVRVFFDGNIKAIGR
ncbi:hypothetical protein MPH47_12130 [Psychrobacillus psychrodurans]|uniref:hypothetical protein n=1 Tax=Psychrobacillus psychrodurans TaxID=126157 RepID=UPI001F4E9C02|nr:hypothetical protein [Psychrobacillus psychrodurans]MCK1997963.1 hypothetical protein [Psychrobacillus psychrodurans]